MAFVASTGEREHAKLPLAVRRCSERLDDSNLLVRAFRGHVEQALAVEQVLQHSDESDAESLAAARLAKDVAMHRLLAVRHVDRPRGPEEAEPARGLATDEDAVGRAPRDFAEYVHLYHRQDFFGLAEVGAAESGGNLVVPDEQCCSVGQHPSHDGQHAAHDGEDPMIERPCSHRCVEEQNGLHRVGEEQGKAMQLAEPLRSVDELDRDDQQHQGDEAWRASGFLTSEVCFAHRATPPTRTQSCLTMLWFDGYSGTGSAAASCGLLFANWRTAAIAAIAPL